MTDAVAGFDWDDGNREKCRKHGVSLREIEFLLGGEFGVAPDPHHSREESRFIAIGRTAEGRGIFVRSRFA